VIRLGDDGLTVEEIAPGIDLGRDVIDRSPARLNVSPNLREMDPALFRPDPIGLRP